MKRLPIVISVLFFCFPAAGQNIPVRDQAYSEIFYYNPAVVRRDNGMYADLYMRYEFCKNSTYGSNPLDVAAEALMVKGDYAVGASVSHDALSYFDASLVGGSYLHRFRFGEGNRHSISLGGRFILGFGRVDLSKIQGFNTEVYGKMYKIFVNPDIDLGLEYSYRFLHIGISTKNLISLPGRITAPYEKEAVTYFRYPRALYGHLSFDVNIRDVVALHPNVIIGLNQNVFLNTGINVTFLKDYDFIYSFIGPELLHHFGLHAYVCSRVHLGVGYSFSSIRNLSALTLRIGVKMSN